MPLILTVTPALNTDGTHASAGRGPLFDGMVAGREVVYRSTQPLVDGARALLAEGVDPRTRIMMRHTGSDTDVLRATVGAAAKLSVREGDDAPRFRDWMPLPPRPGTPPMRQTELAATEAAE
jgi:hypothetical protein